MAKKRNKPKHPVAKPELAEKALINGQYREAIGFYKTLLKQDNRPEWIQNLAESYAGRAQQLQDKGMYKEALVIWQNWRQQNNSDTLHPAYFDLLIQMNRQDDAIQQYIQHVNNNTSNSLLNEIQTKIAAICVSGKWHLINSLPVDDPIRQHAPSAQTALNNYCQGKTFDLKNIPYRSPFRDFSTILKGLALFDNDPDRATNIISRIAHHSAFVQLKEVALMALSPKLDWLNESPAVQQFVAALKGWDKQRLEISQQLLIQKKDCSPTKLLHYLYNNDFNCDSEWLKQTIRQLHFQCQKQGNAYQQPTNNTLLSKLDKLLIHAWYCGNGDFDLIDIQESWQDVIDHIEEHHSNALNLIQTLQIALIQRHIASFYELTKIQNNTTYKKIVSTLENSLILDPNDKNTVLNLIKNYLHRKQLKQARQHLDAAFKQWPNDADILMVAVETAIAGQAYKKAAKWVTQLLILDPINTHAKQMMFDASLSHAKKLMHKNRFDLAEKELDIVYEWAHTPILKGRCLSYRGVLNLRANKAAHSTPLFIDALTHFGDGLYARLELSLILKSNGHNPKTILNQPEMTLQKPTSKQELVTICHWINHTLDQLQITDDLCQLLSANLSAIKTCSKLDMSQADFDLSCNTWHNAKMENLRHIYAKSALKHWPDAPAFKWHCAEAAFFKKNNRFLTEKEIDHLMDIKDCATQINDHKTAYKITELVDKFSYGFNPFFDLDDDDEDEYDEFDDFSMQPGFTSLLGVMDGMGGKILAREMLNTMPEDMLEKIRALMGADGPIKFIDALLSGQSPEDIFRSDPKLAKMMEQL